MAGTAITRILRRRRSGAERGIELARVGGRRWRGKPLYRRIGNNCAVRKVTAATGIISSLVGHPNPNPEYNDCGLSGDGGPAPDASLGDPNGVAVDASGNVFVADSTNALVRMISVNDGNIYTVAGSYTTNTWGNAGNRGYSGDGGPAVYAELNWPCGRGPGSPRQLIHRRRGQ